jgi:hypothetical protein
MATWAEEEQGWWLEVMGFWILLEGEQTGFAGRLGVGEREDWAEQVVKTGSVVGFVHVQFGKCLVSSLELCRIKAIGVQEGGLYCHSNVSLHSVDGTTGS